MSINWRYTVDAYHPTLNAWTREQFLFPRDAEHRAEELKAIGCQHVRCYQRRNNAMGQGSLAQAGLYRREGVAHSREHDRGRRFNRG